MTVGFHSPLPPARSGVADYAASLLRALRQHGEVHVDALDADAHLYHIGNNQLHRRIYRQALERPGVIVLHDAVLQHFFLGSLSEQDYVDEFVYNYGEWHRDRAHILWRDRAGSATDDRYFRHGMLKRIADRSRAVVVHNSAAAAQVRAHARDANVVVIPHLFDAPPDPDPMAEINFRYRLGIPLDAFVFGVFGYLRESKRVLQALEAFAELRSAEPRVAMLVAGDFVSSDLERSCTPLLRSPGVYRVPYLDEKEFWTAASSIDACINLRVPAAGETSGITVRMMGLGKALLLTDAAENAGYPEGSYLPVPAGVAERAALFDYICILSRDRISSSEIGRMAAGHIRREHSLARVSELYWDLLCESAASLASA